jgi:membrane protease YdiL (CAAX protease family)
MFMVALWIIFSYLLNPIQGQYVAVAITLLGIFLFGYLNKMGFKRKNILNSLRYTSLVLIGSLYSLVLSIIYVKQYELYYPGMYLIISIILQVIGIAFFEEILWRGIFLNTIMYKFRKNRKGVYYAIIVPSILFGLSHLTNLINSPEILFGIISQVIYSMTAGVLYSIVYIKYRNIWSGIIIHALFNLASVFPFVFLRVNYWLIMPYVLNLHSRPLIAFIDSIIAIPCLIYAIYIFKKLQVNNIIEE